jgi:hypothetical protein
MSDLTKHTEARVVNEGVPLVPVQLHSCANCGAVCVACKPCPDGWAGCKCGEPPVPAAPVPMLLHCPRCLTQHVDAPDEAKGWTNPPHRSHLCHACGTVWRPADVATTGVASIETSDAAPVPAAPVPMLLHCPRCLTQHVDAPDEAKGWTNQPHRSHLCHACGTVWRPADVATTGVASIGTSGAADTREGEGRRFRIQVREVRPCTKCHHDAEQKSTVDWNCDDVFCCPCLRSGGCTVASA